MRNELEESILYIAATRPALFYGIPLPLAGAMLMVAGLLIIFLKNPLYEVIMLPIWFGARIVVEKDYNAGNVVLLWLRTSAKTVDTSIWGGASVAPMPIRANANPRGVC